MGLFAPPVRDFDGRKTLRSLADALEKLRELEGLRGDEKAKIRAVGIRLPDGRLTAFILVAGPKRPDGSMSVVLMPSAAKFSARTVAGEKQTYVVPVLDEALSDAEGSVELTNGLVLRQIDFIPAPAHYELSSRDHTILLLTLVYLGVDEECYLDVDKQLLPKLPGFRFDAIAKVHVAHLKTILPFVSRYMRQPISLSVLAKTLARAGMQLPRTPRRKIATTLSP